MTDNWSDDELAAAVAAYQEMAEWEDAKVPYSKAGVYRKLAGQFNRSAGAFGRRMQNISAVLAKQNKNWIPGLKPASHVGAAVESRIATLLAKVGEQKYSSPNSKLATREKSSNIRNWLINVARAKEQVTDDDVMKLFGLDRSGFNEAVDFLRREAEILGEPFITALITSNKNSHREPGQVKEYQPIAVDAAQKFLYEHLDKPRTPPDSKELPSEKLAIRAQKFAIRESRPEQALFRLAVFERCNGKCVISGCEVGETLDAAHQHGRDWRLGHNKGTDGYLLRKDLHALYDNSWLTIDQNGVIAIHKHSHFDHFRGYAGKKISVEEQVHQTKKAPE